MPKSKLLFTVSSRNNMLLEIGKYVILVSWGDEATLVADSVDLSIDLPEMDGVICYAMSPTGKSTS